MLSEVCFGDHFLKSDKLLDVLHANVLFDVEVFDTKIVLYTFFNVQYFLLVFSYILGAISFVLMPVIHGAIQKFALSPLPTVTIVAAVKRSLSSLLHGFPRPIEDLLSSTHSCHNYRNLR
jgi:hypothetical protein